MFRSFVRATRLPARSYTSGFSNTQFQAIARPSFAANQNCSFTSDSSLLFTHTANYCTVKPRDTKAAFQAGNVEETIAKWEREANVSELNLVTEKLGFDRKRYKDVSVQMNDIITLRAKLLGNEHPETLYSNATLAAIYRVVGKHKSATNIIRQCLSTIETLISDPKDIDYTQKDLFILFASCVEEFGRIHLANKEIDLARRAVERGIVIIEEQVTKENQNDYLVHLALLNKLAAEICLELKKYQDGKDYLTKSDAVISKMPENVRLRYFLLNHWHGKATAKFRNNLLAAKFHANLGEWDDAEKTLNDAWGLAVANKGANSIECCNAFFELLDFYSDLIPARISTDEYVRLLGNGLSVARKTDKILRETRGLDKRIVFPYYQMIQRGLRTLLKLGDQRKACISLLYECLRIHEKYPAIYPTNEEDLFTKVMSLVQLLREEKQFSSALELITKYKDQFSQLQDKNPDYVIPLIEIQAQLIISTCFGDKPPTPSANGNIPLAEQMKITTQTRDAVEGLEYIVNFYKKKKNKEGTIRTLHTLAIVETLQEEYSYAERECYQCIKTIDPNYGEFTSRVDVSTDKVPLSQIARLADLIILRGSLLRVQHESSRAINHYKAALELLTISRQSLTDNKTLKIKDDLSRASDILRCLTFMMDITKSTLSEMKNSNETKKKEETEKFLLSCEEHYKTVSDELNRLHARLERKQPQNASKLAKE